MDQAITFNKSLQERLQDYDTVFPEPSVPYSQLKNYCKYYLELSVDPNGWQAIWKIPRLKCEQYKVSFPTMVLVYVLNIDFSELTACVRVLGVQDDINLPMQHHVPLIQLWPTKGQDKSIGLNMDSTADALDVIRFLYMYLVMPWDEDEDSEDWKGSHLVSRLRLYFDLRNGKIPKPTCIHAFNLLNEARRLNSKKQQLIELQHGKDSDDEDISGTKQMENLIEINVRLIEIQNEMNFVENELFRDVILKRQQLSGNGNGADKNPQFWLISKPETPSNYIQLLKQVEQIYPQERLLFQSNFMETLQSANQGDTILLSPGAHTVQNEGAVIIGYSVIGIGDKQRVEILSNVDGVMFESGEVSQLENINFDCQTADYAFVVRKGHLTLKNCVLVGNKSFTTRAGILVLSGAQLSLLSCKLSGFSTTVIGNSDSRIQIQGCEISDSYTGVKIFDKCQLDMAKTEIRNCKDYGVVVETETDVADLTVGDHFDDLKSFDHVTIDSVTGCNNEKGNVSVKYLNIQAMDNLFENPALDPTMLVFDDEDDSEMEPLNGTVIEID